MKASAILGFGCTHPRHRERGITMVLVAVAMVAIIAMAALSIDVVTLYLAREEAQRSADAGALAAARVISLSGITGDPTNESSSWQLICGGNTSPASQAAQTAAQQNVIGGIAVAASSVTVKYSAGSGSSSGSNTDCSALAGNPAPFGVNPMVTVQVTRPSLPTFFSRAWGYAGNSVSATATAEAFNPSNSGNVGNGPTGTITPVQPRCVKPWIVPNYDPLNPSPNGQKYCDQGGNGPCQTLVSTADGSITNPGISPTGVIGERFWLIVDCHHNGTSCSLRGVSPNPQIQANLPKAGNQHIESPPSLDYVPGQTLNASAAVPSCSGASFYAQAVAGCDQSTVYQCGVQKANKIDLSVNPDGSGDTPNGVQCLINQGNTGGDQPSGQDYLNLNLNLTPTYPFQILEGSSNPLKAAGLASATPITSSTSIVSLPIYDDVAVNTINTTGTTDVTIVGFLQVFINSADQWGNVNVTVMNVAGCGGGSTPPNSAVTGTSPVPIRLITPP